MVSIPDWSRFRRGIPPPPSPQGNRRAMTPRERYIRAMEKEAISEASKKGYFLEPAQEQIVEQFGETYGAEDPHTGLPMRKQVWHVNHIRFSLRHMKSLGDIPLFSRITILTLDHNYLENIDALSSLKDLIKLDLHSNQISVLPDGIFWSQMQKLRLLLLHDNPIVRVEVIHSLAACGRLQILTLYDSPLSLKRNYRHHVVNTLWSLKALDRHVVSDEEIIEDAVFKHTRFSTLGKVFEVDVSPSYPKPGASFEEELIGIRNVMTRVNRVMAHYCPVLIIQKNIRFWLTYKRYRLYIESRIWAASTIQKAWRRYKKIPQQTVIDPDLEELLTPSVLRLPGMPSTPPVRSSSLVQSKSRQNTTPLYQSVSGKADGITTGQKGRLATKKSLMIDLQKLQKISREREESLNIAYILTQAHRITLKKVPGQVPGTRTYPAPPDPPGRRPLMHQRYFFGPMILSSEEVADNRIVEQTPQLLPALSFKHEHIPESSLPIDYLRISQDSSGEVPRIAFRLKGQQQKIDHIDRFEDIVLTRKEHGQDVRDMETSMHDRRAKLPTATRVKRDVNLKDKFLFERIQQTMALSSLAAVQQAYRDRDLDEKQSVKTQAVMEMRERRELAKERVKAFHEERKLLVLASRQDQKKYLRDSLNEQEIKASKDTNEMMSHSKKVKTHLHRRDAEIKFARDFRMQQTSVSKALIRHDRQVQYDTKLHGKVERVEALKDMEREQQEIVRKYLQHRKMMRQSENTMARAALDTRMLQDANDRVFEAKSRVEQRKSRQEQAKHYASIPQTAIMAPDYNYSTIYSSMQNMADNAMRNSRKKKSRSVFQFYIPSPMTSGDRPDTRLTMSGGARRD